MSNSTSTSNSNNGTRATIDMSSPVARGVTFALVGAGLTYMYSTANPTAEQPIAVAPAAVPTVPTPVAPAVAPAPPAPVSNMSPAEAILIESQGAQLREATAQLKELQALNARLMAQLERAQSVSANTEVRVTNAVASNQNKDIQLRDICNWARNILDFHTSGYVPSCYSYWGVK